jgi:hypothetical protein
VTRPDIVLRIFVREFVSSFDGIAAIRIIFVCWCFLHYDALPAAASVLGRIAHIHLALWCAGAERAGAGGVRGHLFVVATDLADEVVEGVLDVDAGLGGGFDELTAELAGERFALCCTRGIVSGIRDSELSLGFEGKGEFKGC